MAIKKIRANFHNGTQYDVHHYETQAQQVLIMDESGNAISTIEEAILKGKLVNSGNLNSLKNTGLYQISGGTNLPSGVDATKNYLMSVKATGTVVHQEFIDHIKNNVHLRMIDGSTIGVWVATGKSVADSIKSIVDTIGSVSGLKTVIKTNVVSSINEVVENISKINTNIDSVKNRVTALESHNHDGIYAKLSGSKLTGSMSMSNGKQYRGEDTGGTQLTIGGVDAQNKVVLGDERANTYIKSKDGILSVWDGSNSYRVLHSGKMGANSGIDADKLDGLHASDIPQLDKINVFNDSMVIKNGKSLFLDSVVGTTNSGNLAFRDSKYNILAYVGADEAGALHLKAGGSTAFKILSSGNTNTEYDHILSAKNRQVALRFKLNDSDAGAGFYMNSTSKQVGFYDWEYGGSIFSTDRDDQTVKFTNEIFIQGRRLSIQGSAPSGAKAGDIWIDI